MTAQHEAARECETTRWIPRHRPATVRRNVPGGRTTEPAPPALIARFSAILDRFPDAERRKMFGYPAAFVGGNLATGLYGEGWMVRLGPKEAARVIADGRAIAFEPMPGRPMQGYVLLPREDIENDEVIEAWVGRALAYAAGLPAKR